MREPQKCERERERAQQTTILDRFWLSCGLGEASKQHWGFLEALVRPGRAALGSCAGILSRTDLQPAQPAAIRQHILARAIRIQKRDCLSIGAFPPVVEEAVIVYGGFMT